MLQRMKDEILLVKLPSSQGIPVLRYQVLKLTPSTKISSWAIICDVTLLLVESYPLFFLDFSKATTCCTKV